MGESERARSYFLVEDYAVDMGGLDHLFLLEILACPNYYESMG